MSLFREKGNKERAGSIQKYNPSKLTDRREKKMEQSLQLMQREFPADKIIIAKERILPAAISVIAIVCFVYSELSAPK